VTPTTMYRSDWLSAIDSSSSDGRRDSAGSTGHNSTERWINSF
jgi:hypothetical protein